MRAADLKLLFGEQLLGLVRVFDVRRGKRLVQHLDKRRCRQGVIGKKRRSFMAAARPSSETTGR